ncbi:MAG: hypothetical protein WDO13_04030 [Verrucomicrobiota bacterium]
MLLFFRFCLRGTVLYVRSFNPFLLIVFAWVPIRFLMNPIYKFGASVEGGSGVSGMTPYFNYVVAGFSLVFIGAILTSRAKVLSFMRWSLLTAVLVGIFLSVCAFIPSSTFLLNAMGIWNAGEMAHGVHPRHRPAKLRLVPGGSGTLPCPFQPEETRLPPLSCFKPGFS